MDHPTEICFSQFERLQVQSQGVGRLGFCWGLSSWLPGRRLLAIRAHGSLCFHSSIPGVCSPPCEDIGRGAQDATFRSRHVVGLGLRPVNVGDRVQSVPRDCSSNAAVKGRRWCASAYSIRQDSHWIVPTGHIGCRPRCEPNKRTFHRTGGCSAD